MTDWVYLAIGPNVWGRSETAQGALRHCRNSYGPGMKEWTILRFPKDSRPFVDQMGNIHWTKVEDGDHQTFDHLTAAQVVERRISVEERKKHV